MEQVTFGVKGMTCGHCVRAVEQQVKKLAGVQGVEVNLDAARAKVMFDPQTTSVAAIAAAIQDEGYEATPL